MKKIKFLVLCLSAFVLLFACGNPKSQPSGSSQSQSNIPPQESKTKLESFQKQTGSVVIKGYSEVGNIIGLGSISVECIEFTDATTRRHQMGIIIEVKESGELNTSDRSFIDYDEIEPLLKGIDYISNVNPTVTKLSGFEAIYRTKGDFKVVSFSSSGKVEAAVSSGYIRPTYAYISLRDLAELRKIISEAKAKLDTIK